MRSSVIRRYSYVMTKASEREEVAGGLEIGLAGWMS